MRLRPLGHLSGRERGRASDEKEVLSLEPDRPRDGDDVRPRPGPGGEAEVDAGVAGRHHHAGIAVVEDVAAVAVERVPVEERGAEVDVVALSGAEVGDRVLPVARADSPFRQDFTALVGQAARSSFLKAA